LGYFGAEAAASWEIKIFKKLLACNIVIVDPKKVAQSKVSQYLVYTVKTATVCARDRGLHNNNQ
jgi:hypothetical protein